MSDNVNLRISGQFTLPQSSGVQETEAPVNRLELLKLGGEESEGITGQMKSGSIKVEVGEGQNPPDTHGTGTAKGKGVKEFFQKIGAGIVGLFNKAADGLGKLADAFKLRNVEAIDVNKMGMKVAEAVHANDTDALKKAVKGMALLFTEIQVKNSDQANRSIDQVMDDSFKLSGSEGKAILSGDVDQMKAMLPALRKTFADDPVALKVLDRMQAFDFDEAHFEDLDKNLSGLRNVDFKTGMGNTGLGTFLRANTFFSAAMKADQLKTFDPEVYSKELLQKNMGGINVVVDMANTMNELGGAKITKLDNSIGNPLAEAVLDVVRDFMTDLVKVDGPDGLKERFGEAHLKMLKEAADYIIAQEDILPELRNEAVFKLYNNDLFLRGVIAAMTIDPLSQNVPMNGGKLVSGLVQSILNDASGGKMSTDMREGFIELRDEFQDKLRTAFILLGMPVVGVD